MSFSTKQIVTEEDWDSNKNRPKSHLRGRLDLVKVRRKLDNWEETIIGLFRQDGGQMTPDQYRQELKYQLGLEARMEDLPNELLPYLDNYIEKQKERSGTTKTSWGKYAALQTHLTHFVEETKQTISFTQIDWSFRESFLEWLFSPPRLFSINNASKLIAALKVILKDAYRKGVHSNRIFDDQAFTVRRVKTKNKVRLTVAELKQIEEFDFSETEKLDKARDLLIFGAWTGLRISDWHSLGRKNFKKRKGLDYIETATQKTKTPVLIPVTPQVSAIFEKYNYSLPSMSDQHFNRTIKEVCKIAIPEATFTRIFSEGGKRKQELRYKWEFVSSHSGRRSFASNLYEMTQRAYPIMQITGHESEKVFFEYIDLKREQALDELAGPLIELAGG